MITESNDDAEAAKSDARPSQAVAAVNSGPDPAPAKILRPRRAGGKMQRILGKPLS
ncbi:hypothetical protein MSIMFB_04137 [Mycobacterium simulans]|uniref:Uncharacterized protein n=1 Tax=Mycobacterium simulans TaxID=627089 RepID=A0A7Z7IN42_9MYCO|nr:hypothetical protein MSIMFB_04137 [Mycobacterium simulans]